MVFGNQNENSKPVKKAELVRDSAVTILTSGCHFKGKLYCRGSTRIGGRVEGDIISEGLLIIEEEALIQTGIKADDVIIQGRVEGTLEARGRVELCASCRYTGDIVTPVLVIREGASFNGSAKMNLEPVADVSESDMQEKIIAPTVVEDFEQDESNQIEVAALKTSEGRVNIA